ncbi:MAG TPA: hypothetical protein VFC72_02965 [Corynebacterium sp.]|nr:hypothetical protein [Corynebacterium sp.]
MGLTITAIVIAVLAGIGTFYSWTSNRKLSLGLAVVTLLAGAAGTIGAFIAALHLLLKLLPILLMVGGIWLIWRIFQMNRDSSRNEVN